MILVIGPGGCGFTFLAWTISFLRGDTFYTRLSGETIPMIDNPLTGVTAHLFAKDHIKSSTEIPQLKLSNPNSIVYLVPTHQSDVDCVLQSSGKKIIFQNHPDYAQELFARMCIAIPNSKYTEIINQLNHDKNSIKQVMLECNHFFTNYYQIPTKYTDQLTVNYADIFQTLDKKIDEVFEYLGASIDSTRLSAWIEVYQQYRCNNQNFQKRFLPDTVNVDTTTRLKILKEILAWTNGSSLQQ